MKVAIFAHSTNPRGGVTHALALGEALSDAGHAATVFAPDASGRGFYRSARCRTVALAASPAAPGLAALVATRASEVVRHLEPARHRDFDVFHAQDGISVYALATLTERGLIAGYARTVHHVDSFADPAVNAMQRRGIVSAAAHFAVSAVWQEALRCDYGIDATVVGNGVDRAMFGSVPDGREGMLRTKLGLGDGPVFLAVGGIEARKNTRAILAAFAEVHAVQGDARLVVAGGASLLDHGTYQGAFHADLAASGLAASVAITGPLPQDDMPALYRVAVALVFPSVSEGFGLVALEAIACGTPAIVSAIAPFTEHFASGDVLWCDPLEPSSIAAAMRLALAPGTPARLAARADAAIAPHTWAAVAARHLPTYARLAAREAVLA